MVIDISGFPYEATLLSAFLAFGLGMVWYHPKAMGERWLSERKQASGQTAMTPFAGILSLGLWLIAACFYSFLLILLDVSSLNAFLSVSCLLWVAFSMPPILMGFLYTGYPSFKTVAIDASYQLTGYYIFALVHFVFTAGFF